MPLLWLNCLRPGLLRKHRTADLRHASPKNPTFRERIKKKTGLFLYSTIWHFSVYPVSSEKVTEGHVRMRDECSFLSSHPERPLAVQHRQPSCDRQSTNHISASNVTLSCFSHMSLFPKTQEVWYVIPGSNYFLGYGLWFSLATAAGLPLPESCPTDCISQTAPWLTASLTATGSLKKTWNIKDLER